MPKTLVTKVWFAMDHVGEMRASVRGEIVQPITLFPNPINHLLHGQILHHTKSGKMSHYNSRLV